MSTQSAPSSPLLRVTDLGVAYGRVRAVQSVSLEVGAGEFVAVIGSNGAGKSSTMKAISGVLAPVAGRIEFNGTDVTGLPSHRLVRAGLAMVPEGRQVFAEQTVEDNLRLGAFVFAATPARIDEAVERGFTLFPRLAERRAQAAGSLSGGEQQMLAIARGMMARPRILLLDEPSLGLAPAIINSLYATVAELRDQGITILIVDQMAALALTVADRGYVLEQGRVAASGTAAELKADAALEAAYLGAA